MSLVHVLHVSLFYVVVVFATCEKCVSHAGSLCSTRVVSHHVIKCHIALPLLVHTYYKYNGCYAYDITIAVINSSIIIIMIMIMSIKGYLEVCSGVGGVIWLTRTPRIEDNKGTT